MDEDLKRLVEKNAAETRQHFDVVAERLEKKIELLAEGLLHVDEKISRVDGKVDTIEEKMRLGFADTQAMIKFSHAELDRRLRSLEDVVADLQARVERLESGSTH